MQIFPFKVHMREKNDILQFWSDLAIVFLLQWRHNFSHQRRTFDATNHTMHIARDNIRDIISNFIESISQKCVYYNLWLYIIVGLHNAKIFGCGSTEHNFRRSFFQQGC